MVRHIGGVITVSFQTKTWSGEDRQYRQQREGWRRSQWNGAEFKLRSCNAWMNPLSAAYPEYGWCYWVIITQMDLRALCGNAMLQDGSRLLGRIVLWVIPSRNCLHPKHTQHTHTQTYRLLCVCMNSCAFFCRIWDLYWWGGRLPGPSP